MNTTNIILEKFQIIHIRIGGTKEDYFGLTGNVREYYSKINGRNNNYFIIMDDIEQNVYFF